jgi:hypothetical protein
MGFWYPFALKGWTALAFPNDSFENLSEKSINEAIKVNKEIPEWLAKMLQDSGEPWRRQHPIEQIRRRYVAFKRGELGFASEHYRMNQFLKDDLYLSKHDKEFLGNNR